MTHVVFCDNIVLFILNMPPDGNCLFSSLAHQIFGSQQSIDGVAAPKFLRGRVVQYLRNNLSEYSPCLIAEALIVQRSLTLPDNFSPSQMIEAFVNYLSMEGSYGGSETIAAIVHLYQRQLTIFQENGPTLVFGDQYAINGNLCIYYSVFRSMERACGRLEGFDRNHYDSVVNSIPVEAYRDQITSRESGLVCLSQPRAGICAAQSRGGINMYELDFLTPSTVADETIPKLDLTTNIIFGSLNCSGCSDESKRNLMDHEFNERGLALVLLQETRMSSGALITNNYVWFNFNEELPRSRIPQGSAIMIHRSLYDRHIVHKISDTICSVTIDIFGEPLVFNSVYIPPSNYPEASLQFNNLRQHHERLTRLGLKSCYQGDLNSRIGIFLPSNIKPIIFKFLSPF